MSTRDGLRVGKQSPMVMTASTDTDDSVNPVETDNPLVLLLLLLLLLLTLVLVLAFPEEEDDVVASIDNEAMVSPSLIATDFRFLIFRDESLPPPLLLLLSGVDKVGLDMA